MKNKQNSSQEEQIRMYSTLELGSRTPLDKQDIRKSKIIVKSLCEHNQAYDFKTPVDWKGMNLSDYPLIVKHPMDLGTVEKLLNSGKLQTVEEFLDHIQLIWDNCKIYNQAGSWIYESAIKIQRIFKKMIKNYFPDIPITIPQKPQTQKSQKNANSMFDNLSDEDITYYEKLNFSERVEQLDSHELERMIQYLQQKYPETLKEVPNPVIRTQAGQQKVECRDRVQILVDSFTATIFHEINEFMNALAEEKGQQVNGVKRVKNM